MRGFWRPGPLLWLGALLGLYLAVPLVAFVVRFVGSNQRGFGEPGLAGALYVSTVCSTISLSIIALLGIPLAYVLARSRRRLVGVLGVVVQLPLALPPVMSGILLIYLVGPYTTVGRFFGGNLTNSMAGIVLAQTFVAAPFLVVTARAAFSAVDPGLLDVAATLGHGELSRFARVAIPVAAAGIRAGLVLAWLRAFGEYGATVVVAYHPFTLPVYTFNQFSMAGLPTTQAPTALALAAACIVVLVSRARWPRRRATPLPVPTAPDAVGLPRTMAFDLDARVGTFRVEADWRSASGHMAIVGPSGSGKSTVLRALAGVGEMGAGSVAVGGREISDVAPEDRRVGYVAQGFSLFPHLRVREQLLFAKGASAGEAAYWLDRFGLGGLEDRLPRELSGGQRQRVALAQALCRSPDLLLLDEPFSALDAPVRRDLRAELRSLQRKNGVTTVLVTHDPEEAAVLADEIIVLVEGQVAQAGPRRLVYGRPTSPTVGHLLGVSNVHAGTTTERGLLLPGGLHVDVPGVDVLGPGVPVWWSIRPERIALGPPDSWELRGDVTDVTDLGSVVDVEVQLADSLVLRARSFQPVEEGPCSLRLPTEAIDVWPAAPSEGPPRRGDGPATPPGGVTMPGATTPPPA